MESIYSTVKVDVLRVFKPHLCHVLGHASNVDSTVFHRFFHGEREKSHFNFLKIVINQSFQSQLFIGVICFVYGTSFVHTLVAEIPFVNLEKILLGGSNSWNSPKLTKSKYFNLLILGLMSRKKKEEPSKPKEMVKNGAAEEPN